MKTVIVVKGVSQRQTSSYGGSRSPAAAAHSGCVRCAESGCLPRARLKCAESGCYPGRDTGYAESGCLPGRDDSCAEDGISSDETNISCVNDYWIIIV